MADFKRAARQILAELLALYQLDGDMLLFILDIFAGRERPVLSAFESPSV